MMKCHAYMPIDLSVFQIAALLRQDSKPQLVAAIAWSLLYLGPPAPLYHEVAGCILIDYC